MRCEEFIPTVRFKLVHDFLKYYDEGKNIIDEKPLNITKVGKITKFEINYQENSSFYDFYDSVNVVEEFLFNVKNKVKRSKNEFFIRFGFSLENI